jgi:hypothetical protein
MRKVAEVTEMEDMKEVEAMTGMEDMTGTEVMTNDIRKDRRCLKLLTVYSSKYGSTTEPRPPG